ncbi:HU family DNA-binding protein [Sulfitobacter sp. S190]|uniref:HU family DNA-binding protein n=1 Tax=Sulfitobacter sp. S190 TaxID=2867022 RepID=UPI0021A6C5A7|nr:HU family DNA-binding protein [Sulfitobacter sp. S190]
MTTSTKPKTSRKAPTRKPASKKATTKVSPPETPTPVRADSAAAPAAAPVEAAVVNKLSLVVMGQELRKKELINLVVERSGIKKKDAKPVVEAMLSVLGEALSENREMVLQPLGRLKIQRAKELSDGRAMVLKLRQKDAKPPMDAPAIKVAE